MTTTIFELDDSFSTTRRISKIPPIIVNQPEDKVNTLLFLPPNPQRKAEGGLRTQGYFKHNEQDKPLISIITVVFNGEKYLEQTIRSVIEQNYDNVEYIIVDGGSTNGTLDIIKRYEGQIDYWVSEPDKGISDAFNKGISLATGEIIGIINADDWYERNSVSEVISNINVNNAEVIQGILQLWEGKRKGVLSRVEEFHPFNITINHPTVFAKKDVYKKYGLFRLDYKYAMDCEWFFRIKSADVVILYVEKILANMQDGGVSDKHWKLAHRELIRAKSTHFGNSYRHKLFYYLAVFKGTIRRWLDKNGLNQVTRMYRKLTQNAYN